jgi:hypothetical protein
MFFITESVRHKTNDIFAALRLGVTQLRHAKALRRKENMRGFREKGTNYAEHIHRIEHLEIQRPLILWLHIGRTFGRHHDHRHFNRLAVAGSAGRT